MLRRCSEYGKTAAPLHSKDKVDADVYFESSEMADVLKVSTRDRYVKVQPGISLATLRK